MTTQPDRLREALDDHELMTNPAECTCGEWTYRDEKPGNYFNDHLASVIRAALAEAAPAPDLVAAVERLSEAISGERRDWHKVEVRPDDIAVLLRSAPASREAGLDAERLALALHAFYAGKDTRDEFFPADCNHREDAAIIAVAYAADDPNAAIAAEYGRLAASPVTEE